MGGLRCAESTWPTRGDVRPMKDRTYQNPLSEKVVTTQQVSTVAQAAEGTNFPPREAFAAAVTTDGNEYLALHPPKPAVNGDGSL